MAGFLKGLQNMMAGKPVFEETATSSAPPQVSTQQTSSSQRHSLPVAKIVEVEYNERGNQMSLNIHVKNESTETILLHRLNMLGRQDNLGYQLQPGQSRELVEVYRGPMLPDTSRRVIELDYKGADGKLFRSLHRAEYEREASGAYGVHRVVFEQPIRNI